VASEPRVEIPSHARDPCDAKFASLDRFRFKLTRYATADSPRRNNFAEMSDGDSESIIPDLLMCMN
jgi:hypothetical protein